MLSGQLGVDFGIDPSAPLKDVPCQASGVRMQRGRSADEDDGVRRPTRTLPLHATGHRAEFGRRPAPVFLDDAARDVHAGPYTRVAEEFVELVVPELRRRGCYRARYPERPYRTTFAET
jgi:hypothetical protein